jgi:L-lactate dehydrogenase complex protein LldG
VNEVHNHRARAAILARLRAAAPPDAVDAPDLDGYYAITAPPGGDARVERFMTQARGWRAEVIVTDDAGWTRALADVLAAKGVRRLLAGRGTTICADLSGAASSSTGPAVELCWYDQSMETFKDALFSTVDAGITTTLGGIAETGSLIIWPDANEPRTLSLVPPLHIAVLRASTLHATLYAALRTQHWAERLPTNALLVTGPSKTADIQRLLVYGAHGPKELVILLLRDEAEST